jgi:EmrB/QacA subfamily drug resistance transporter
MIDISSKCLGLETKGITMSTPKDAEEQASQKSSGASPRIAVSPDAGLHGKAALSAMLGIMAVTILIALDATMVSSALPRVVGELGGFELYAWVATANLLTSTIMVPIFGALGDQYGRKPFLLASVVIFCLASVFTASVQSMPMLILGRALQGIGSGMLQATAFTSISDIFPQPDRRARWQGLLTSTFALSSLFGPTLGGLLTQWVGWRSIFLLCLPVAVVALPLIVKTLPSDLSPRQTGRGIDWWGTGLITVAISTLLIALSWGGKNYPWFSPVIIGLFVLFLVVLAAFVWAETKAKSPLMPLDMFKDNTLVVLNVASLLLGFMSLSISYYTPLLFQGGLGLDPQTAALYFTPIVISNALGSLTGSQIFARTRRMKGLLLIGGTLIVLGSSTLLLTVNINTAPGLLSIVLPMTGFGIGMIMPMITILVQSIVPRARLGVATSTIQFTRLLGSMFGTSIVGTIVTGVFSGTINRAVTADMDPRLATAYSNPQALINEEVSANLSQIASELGQTAINHIEILSNAARQGLITGVWYSYAMMVVGGLVVLTLIIRLRVPNFRDNSAPATQPATKPATSNK